eukprot:Clim_evm15s109 gene=Clim_evmTU15s109
MAAKKAAGEMFHRALGNSGLQVSVLSYGSWVTFHSQIGVDSSYEIMKRCYELGINFFDNAEVYSSGEAEKIMGECVKKGVADGVWEREDLVISTKLFFGARGKRDTVNSRGLSRKKIVEGTLGSLKRMQLDYVDLIFCHRPDPLTPIEETVRAFNHIIDRGLAFYWGTSEWNAEQLTEAYEIAHRLNMIPPLMDQCQYNLFHREKMERDFMRLFAKHGMGTTIWSPLASGILTCKYSGGKVPEGTRLSLDNYSWLKDRILNQRMGDIEKADALKPIAEKVGCSVAQLSLAWCVKNENVSTVILGATSVKQLEENMECLKYVDRLTPEILAEIEEVVQTKPKWDGVMEQVASIRGVSLSKF